MYRPAKSSAQTSLFSSLEEQLNHKHSLYMLANKINWNVFETEFSKLFNKKMGAPNKPDTPHDGTHHPEARPQCF